MSYQCNNGCGYQCICKPPVHLWVTNVFVSYHLWANQLYICQGIDQEPHPERPGSVQHYGSTLALRRRSTVSPPLCVDFLESGLQSCGSGSGIRCLFDPWIRDPGRIRDEQPGSYFRERRSQFFGLKYLNILFGSGIRDGKKSDPVSGMENIRIRDPG